MTATIAAVKHESDSDNGNRGKMKRPRRANARPQTPRRIPAMLTQSTRVCSIDGCAKPVQARGWCGAHYNRWHRHGDPLCGGPPLVIGWALEERLWSKVDRSGECWIWTGELAKNGYGRLRVAGHNVLVHRFSYELVVGPIPEGLTLDHLCRNPPCVNPAHLEPVTNRENILRGESPWAINARKTHCPQGHEYTPENTYITKGGSRHCRMCGRIRAAAVRAKKKSMKELAA